MAMCRFVLCYETV